MQKKKERTLARHELPVKLRLSSRQYTDWTKQIKLESQNIIAGILELVLVRFGCCYCIVLKQRQATVLISWVNDLNPPKSFFLNIGVRLYIWRYDGQEKTKVTDVEIISALFNDNSLDAVTVAQLCTLDARTSRLLYCIVYPRNCTAHGVWRYKPEMGQVARI